MFHGPPRYKPGDRVTRSTGGGEGGEILEFAGSAHGGLTADLVHTYRVRWDFIPDDDDDDGGYHMETVAHEDEIKPEDAVVSLGRLAWEHPWGKNQP